MEDVLNKRKLSSELVWVVSCKEFTISGAIVSYHDYHLVEFRSDLDATSESTVLRIAHASVSQGVAFTAGHLV